MTTIVDDLTTTVEGVQLLATGTWDASTGKARITPADLAAIIAASGDPHWDGAPLKIGHDDDRFQDAKGNPPSRRDGQPAYGWVQNLRTADGGKTLIGDFVGVPKMLAEIMGTALRRRSVELVRHSKVGGKVFACNLTGLSLLGVQAPAVKGLADLRALFAAADGEQEPECIRMSIEIFEDGAEISDTPTVPHTPTALAERDHQNADPEVGEHMKLDAGQRTALGIPEDATPEQVAEILKGLGLAFDEEAAETPPASPPASAGQGSPPAPAAAPPASVDPLPMPIAASAGEPPAPPSAQEVLAAAGQLGLQVMDVEMFRALQSDAAAGRSARDEQDKNRRDSIIRTAVGTGKIHAAAAKTFRAQLDENENGVTLLLAALPEGRLPREPVGHAEQYTGTETGPAAGEQAVDTGRREVWDHFGISAPPVPATVK